MKKYIVGILLSVCILCAFAFAGCNESTDSIEPFVLGVYETETGEDTENDSLIKIRFIMQPISQEEYESANGINVIKKDSKSADNNIYYSFELYFYNDSQEAYIPATVSDITHIKQSDKNTYDGKVVYSCDDSLIEYDMRLFYRCPDSSITFTSKDENGKYSSLYAICVHKITGRYETFEKIENEIFTKVQYTIKPITQEEYENAYGINVIENQLYDSKNTPYCRFEINFFDGNRKLDCNATISECEYHPTTSHYFGIIEYNYENLHIKRRFGFGFEEPYPTIEFYEGEEISESLTLKFKFISYVI